MNLREQEEEEEEEGGEEEAVDEASLEVKGEHHLIHKELASALWSLSLNNPSTQAAIAEAGAIPLIISLLSSLPPGSCRRLATTANKSFSPKIVRRHRFNNDEPLCCIK